MNENIKKFHEALSKDEAMRNKANELTEKYKGTTPDENTVARETVAFAKSYGFEFTAAELAEYSKAQSKELSDDELEAVAGGVFGENCLCVMGGGGKDPETGKTCACVIGGGGGKDKDGYQLICPLLGGIGKVITF